MAIQKNFVVKNGIEVNENLIFADNTANKVGVGTTVAVEKLQVNGGIGATSIILTGIGTIPILFSDTSNISDAYVNSGIVTSITGTALTYTNADITNLSVDNAYVVSGVVTNLTGTISTITSIDTTNLVGTIGTFTTADVTNLSVDNAYVVSGVVTNLTGTAATIGTVQIVSGIVTASSGIVTYYGDGQYLNLSGNAASGIGIGTTGGVVGYGITFIDLKGAGISTTEYNSSVGIATIFFEGGGSGTIGIGTAFPVSSENGDLFFNTNFGRIYVYYDEVALGVGATAVWIDAAPFNQGLIETLSGIAFTTGSASDPSWYFISDVQTGVFSPTSGEITFVSTASSILNINQSGSIVTGIVTATGFVGDLTGTASTSTASATAYGLSGTPNITVGIVTASSFVGELTGNATGLSGTPGISVGFITATGASISGNVSIGGTLTYEDVTNVDSIGIVTARSGIQIGNPSVSIASTLSSDGSAVFSGIVTAASFSGNATSASTSDQIKTNSTATAASHYLTFVDSNNGSPTSETLYTDAGIIYNPSTNDLTASGNVTAYSDITLKENIETISNALEIVKNLRGVRFNRKDLEGNPLQVGVIAQEVEEFVPEVVRTSEDGLKSVAYGNLIGILIEAVKELSEEVDRLKNN